MSMQIESAAQEAAIFIDLENFIGGLPKAWEVDSYWRWKVKRKLGEVEELLDERGYTVRQKVAFTRGATEYITHSKKKLIVGTNLKAQTEAAEAFSEWGGALAFSKGVADFALIAEVERQLRESLLPPLVVLLTADKDFIPMVEKVKLCGHRVWLVPNGEPNHRWKRVAHEIILMRSRANKLAESPA